MTPLYAFLSSNGLFWSFAAAGIALGILPANGQSAAVSNATIAADVPQAGDVLRDLSAKLSLYDVRTVQDAGNA